MLFLDTSGLLCYIHNNEPQHRNAVEFFDEANTLITHSYILAEFVALAQARHFPRLATLTFINDLLENPNIETVWVGKEVHQKAFNLLMHRLDKKYSLCDAVSFVLMKQRGIREALTTDHHFEKEGFIRLLKP